MCLERGRLHPGNVGCSIQRATARGDAVSLRMNASRDALRTRFAGSSPLAEAEDEDDDGDRDGDDDPDRQQPHRDLADPQLQPHLALAWHPWTSEIIGRGGAEVNR